MSDPINPEEEAKVAAAIIKHTAADAAQVTADASKKVAVIQQKAADVARDAAGPAKDMSEMTCKEAVLHAGDALIVALQKLNEER